jgi:pimeloyl-ACP methyl ester carboxylesterase
MPILLVHGVPETPAIWDGLRSRLGRADVVTPQLPGFGCPRPSGFAATKEAYVEWLISEVEAIGQPVDLVGHDWGGGLVVRLVSLRPDLVRSWVCDAAALGDVTFEWHDFAKLWQTPGAGEQFWEEQLALAAEDRAAVFELAGVPTEQAVRLASPIDETMVECILTLYRSAIDVGKEWAPDFHDIAAPGLVLVASEAPFLSAEGARSAAARAGAGVAELAGLGHWWMLQAPDRGAGVLTEFWSDQGRSG